MSSASKVYPVFIIMPTMSISWMRPYYLPVTGHAIKGS